MDSFVVYRSFHEALSELSMEQYGRVMFAINEYALNGKETELEGIEKICFILIKPQLDANAKRKSSGSLGGRPKPEKEEPLTETIEEENVENIESESETPNMPSGKYAHEVFEIFRNADLPCCNGNELSFMQKDFKNGLSYIRGRYGRVHSDTILQACRNYVRVCNSDDCWHGYRRKMNFDTFVRSKTFENFLPENFRIENFQNYERWGKAEKKEVVERFFEVCPKCGQKRLEWQNNANHYHCDSCGCDMSYEEKQDCERLRSKNGG